MATNASTRRHIACKRHVNTLERYRLLRDFDIFYTMKIPTLVPLTVVCTLIIGSSVHAATVPFSNDFSSTGFTNQSEFTVGSGTLNWSTSSTSSPVAYGTEQFGNLADSTFSASYQFSLSSVGGASGDLALGFGVFASNGALSGGAGNPYLLADYTFSSNVGASRGRLRLLEIASSNTGIGTNGNAQPAASGERTVALNTTYTLRLNVTNTAPNTYNLSLSLFNADGSTQFGSSATATAYSPSWSVPSGGFYLGVRSRVPQSSGTTTMAFDNFAVVPEPSTGLLLIGGTVLLGLIRRKRR